MRIDPNTELVIATDIATRLGADVPVCLADRPALVWGKGESFHPLRRLPPVDAVFVNPRVPLATAGVFAALKSGPASRAEAAPAPPDFSDLDGLLDYVKTYGNDLEAARRVLLVEFDKSRSGLNALRAIREFEVEEVRLSSKLCGIHR